MGRFDRWVGLISKDIRDGFSFFFFLIVPQLPSQRFLRVMVDGYAG